MSYILKYNQASNHCPFGINKERSRCLASSNSEIISRFNLCIWAIMTPLKTLFSFIAKATRALKRGLVNFPKFFLLLSIIHFALVLHCRSLSHFFTPGFYPSALLSCLESLFELYVFLASIWILSFSTLYTTSQIPMPLGLQPRYNTPGFSLSKNKVQTLCLI